METLHISSPVYTTMINYLTAAYPLEACGFLAGKNGEASHFYPIENILHSPVAYEMDPQQQIEAMLDMDAREWEMLAIFHSHPTSPAQPSVTDIAQAYYPESAYVIVSLQDRAHPIVKAFMIANGRYQPISLIITEQL